MRHGSVDRDHQIQRFDNSRRVGEFTPLIGPVMDDHARRRRLGLRSGLALLQ
jgi:hypothetical protein